MTTVDKTIADQVLREQGRNDHLGGEDNPACVRIVEYTTIRGATAYGLVFENDTNQETKYMRETPYIRDPKIYWNRRA